TALAGAYTAIAAGGGHTLALKSDGTIWAWGDNTYGQLGDGSNTQRVTPVQITTLSGVVGIAAGPLHSLALLSDHTVRAWGASSWRQLGMADGAYASHNAPVTVSGLAGAVAIAA